MSTSRRRLNSYAESEYNMDDHGFADDYDGYNDETNRTFKSSVIRHSKGGRFKQGESMAGYQTESYGERVRNNEHFDEKINFIQSSKPRTDLQTQIRRSKSSNRLHHNRPKSHQALPKSHSMKLHGKIPAELSIVEENDLEYRHSSYVPDNEYATLTKENMNKLNDSYSRVDDKLLQYKDTNYDHQNETDYDFEEDDTEFDNKISSTINASEVLSRPDKYSNNLKPTTQNKLSQFTQIPLSKSTITPQQLRLPSSRSLRSLSSFTSSTASSSNSVKSIEEYSENSETGESDYAEDYDLDDASKLNDFGNMGSLTNDDYLIRKFEKRKLEAEKRANLEMIAIDKKLNAIKKRQHFTSSNEDVFEFDHSAIHDDFDDFEELDNLKLQRFINKNNLRYSNQPLKSRPALTKKLSMPSGFIGNKSNHINFGEGSSPQRNLRKTSSTFELSTSTSSPSNSNDPFRSSALQQTISYGKGVGDFKPLFEGREYSGNELDDIDTNLDVNDITITMADLRLLQKKRLIDLEKYAETSSQRKSRGVSNSNGIFDRTITEKLNKEGKLKTIRNLGKPITKKVLAGHKYGEMVYDPHSMKWFGNEEELTKFEVFNKPALIRNNSTLNTVRRPLLNKRASTLNLDSALNTENSNLIQRRIATLMEMPNVQVIDNMIYDPEKLRWVNISGKYEDDPFEGIEDSNCTMTVDKPQNNYIHNGDIGGLPKPESLVTRAISLPSSPNKKNEDLHAQENFLQISRDQFKQWKSEESRWERKVRNWFPNDDDSFNYCYDLKIFLNDN